MPDIVKVAQKIINEKKVLIEKKYEVTIPNITITASGKMTRMFGTASKKLGKYYIKLSKYAFEGKTDTAAFVNTVVHELAHIAESVIFNKFSHSHRWEQLMRDMGEVPSRFVTIDKKAELDYVRPARRVMVKYVHKCEGGCEHHLSGQKHNKVLRGVTYVCRKTKTPVTKSFYTTK